jgi:hypothetical protein
MIGLDHDDHGVMAPVLRPVHVNPLATELTEALQEYRQESPLPHAEHDLLGLGTPLAGHTSRDSAGSTSRENSALKSNEESLDAIDRVLTDLLLDDLRAEEASDDSPDLLENLVVNEDEQHSDLDALLAEFGDR